MSAEVVQVRDVPTADVERLRARASARRMSLSGYLRELIHDDVSRPSMEDVVARIATRDAIEADASDIQAFIADDRRS